MTPQVIMNTSNNAIPEPGDGIDQIIETFSDATQLKQHES